MPQYPDDFIKSILRSTKTIAMVGASGNEMRPTYFAMKYLLDKGFLIHPDQSRHGGKENPRPHGLWLAEGCARPRRHGGYFPRLRCSARQSCDEALAEKDRLGIKTDLDAAWASSTKKPPQRPRAAGLNVVMDRCPKIEYGRLSGEIGWMGVQPPRDRQSQAAAVQQGRLIEARHVMLKIWGRKNSINVQKAMWAIGETGVAHERIDAGGPFGGLDDAGVSSR